ncbi:MAG TPA: BREX-6 system phosphatase PglZ [Polyangiaceae bacterium]|nr:BREX-6 system phosphatase PglZ [Polyangiaceae bacterium]
MLEAVKTPDHVVSRTLADEVKRKVRERGLLLWLDAERQYCDLVDALETGAYDFAYPVVAYRGSYLELMFALEGYGNSDRPEHVLVHLPGLNKETVKETPVFELYKAGISFEKNLNTLIREAARGFATPEEVDAALRESGLTLSTADQWLQGLQEQPRDRLALLLNTLGLDDVVLGLIAEDRRLCDELSKNAETFLVYLEKALGLNAAWRRFRIGTAELNRSRMASLVASWLMCVEFVHDLREAPSTAELLVLTKLGPYAKECCRVAALVRDRHPEVYESLANETQDYLTEERTSHHAGALGSIDTFRFEEATTRRAALAALKRAEWDLAASFAEERTPEGCFWVKRSPPLKNAWELIRLAAATGRALAATEKSLDRCSSLEEATERYADKLALVDRKHREFEQRAHALLSSDLEDYEALLDVRGSVRRAYRTWANDTNRRFCALCANRGALPEPGLRQRTVYEQVVHPLLEQGRRVAFLMVDALRFEMAQGFALDLKREKYHVSLNPRLAELPTDTVIGMNALAPVQRNARLRPVIKGGDFAGFAVGETTVFDPTTRIRVMSQRSVTGTAEDIELEEFQDLSLAQLKRRLSGKPPLLIVRSRELDTAGEHGFHLGTFEQTLALLRSAISLLSQAGVEHFVVCSDHGFLLQDATTENVPFGTGKHAVKRRHALLTQPSGMPDALEIKLSSLEYDVPGDGYLVFRPDTALWQTQSTVAPFAHGGNSLQERVIPVLCIERPGARGKTIAKYEIVAHAEPAHLGRQRLRLAVRLQNQQSGVLGFAAPKHISLALRVPGRSDVTVSLLNAGPPASLVEGRLQLPPNRDEAVVEFELEGEFDEKVRVELFHPDAIEDVTAKVVDGFFDVARNRRLGKARTGDSNGPAYPSAVPDATQSTTERFTSTRPSSSRRPSNQPVAPAQDWRQLIEDEGYRRVLRIIEERRSINEEEMQQVLGSPRRVRAFSRQYDELLKLISFEIEMRTVNGMKTYVRKD